MIEPNSTVLPADRKRVIRQIDIVLARLAEGPATTGDFLAMRISRFGARIQEIRQSGYMVRSERITDREDPEYGLYRYTMFKASCASDIGD